MRVTTLVIIGAIALLVGPGLAMAHAMLGKASPPAGGTVNVAPAELELTFSQALEPRFSSISVTDEAGRRVDKGDPHTVAGDPKRLGVSLGPMPAGRYNVIWQATSVDTHKTEGTYNFIVKP